MTALAPAFAPSRPLDRHKGDRPIGHAVYGLYLIAPFLLGVPALIGLLIAYARQEDAGELERRHFEHQIRTAWTGLTWTAAAVIWGGAAAIGGVGATLGNGVFDWSTAAGLGVLSVGALVVAPLHFLGSTVFGWSRLASGRPVGHDRRR